MKKLLEFAGKSPIHLMFVLQAIDELSTQIVQNEQGVRESTPENSIINIDAWIRVAKDAQELNK